MVIANCWSLDTDLFFQSYSNFNEVNGSTIGIIFGKASSRKIFRVYFCSPIDATTADDSIQFIESSITSDLSFLGILSFIDVTYNYELPLLESTTLDSLGILSLNLIVTHKVMKDRDFDQFKELNSEIELMHSSDICSGRFLVSLSYNLSINVRITTEHLLSDVGEAFMGEYDVIDDICFHNSEFDLLLGYGNATDPTKYQAFVKRHIDDNARIGKCATFKTLKPVSSACGTGEFRYTPHVRIAPGSISMQNIRVQLTTFTFISIDDDISLVTELLRTALKQILCLTERSILNYSDIQSGVVPEIQSLSFRIVDDVINVQYPQTSDEVLNASYRRRFHRIFNLPLIRPLLRKSQALTSKSDTGMLRSPHLHINKYKPKGELYLVQGAYDYYHYLQNGIDDRGWGCAYRSFQTICSYCLLQGFTDKSIPKHNEIQKSLYECGDKDEKFVGSRQWIGSLELSYCLENILGFSSRILRIQSGSEIVSYGDQIAKHFKTNGTPIMIGGGQFAHTILGVDYNQTTGDCAFLVLDPHYTGEDDIDIVISKGWCAWKPQSFWKAEHFYNLLLLNVPNNCI